MHSLLTSGTVIRRRNGHSRAPRQECNVVSLLVEDLSLDSLDLVAVLMKMEDHYHLKIELDDVPNIRYSSVTPG